MSISSPTTPGLDGGVSVDVVAKIEEWNRGLAPHAARRKYQLLTESPLTFFEGCNHLFWADFCADERLSRFGNAETRTWLCGDCHFGSFSAYGNEREGPMYGVCQFDESLIGDYQFDVWRMAVSIVLIAVANGDESQGGEDTQRAAVIAFAKSYLRSILNFRKPREGTVSVITLNALTGYTDGNLKGRLVRFLSVVERELSLKKLLRKWSVLEGDKRRFLPVEGKIQPCPPEERGAIIAAFADLNLTTPNGDAVDEMPTKQGSWILDVARRLDGGVTDCGVPQFLILVEGDDGEEQLLLLRMQKQPTGYHFMTLPEREAYRSQFLNEAHRHSEACKLLSSTTVSYNGWIEITEVHPSIAGFYSIQDFSPYREPYPCLLSVAESKPKLKSLVLNNREALVEMAETWGRILADRHANAACDLDTDSTKGHDSQPHFCAAVRMLTQSEPGAFEELVWDVSRDYAQTVTYNWLCFQDYMPASDRKNM